MFHDKHFWRILLISLGVGFTMKNNYPPPPQIDFLGLVVEGTKSGIWCVSLDQSLELYRWYPLWACFDAWFHRGKRNGLTCFWQNLGKSETLDWSVFFVFFSHLLSLSLSLLVAWSALMINVFCISWVFFHCTLKVEEALRILGPKVHRQKSMEYNNHYKLRTNSETCFQLLGCGYPYFLWGWYYVWGRLQWSTQHIYRYHVHNTICVPSFAPLTESSDPIPAPMSQWESGDPIGGDGGKVHATV